MELKFDDRGLIPAVVQDADTREVLMVAYMNAESARRTLESGDAWFWSRSRQELWHKGDSSGNFQHVVRARTDCDADTVLLEVHPDGPACHTGVTSCFFEEIDAPAAAADQTSAATDRPEARPAAETAAIVSELAGVIAERHATKPEGSYVAGLLEQGIDRVAKKIGEEAAETIIAAKNGAHDEIVWEVADLWFHSLVLLEATGVPVEDVFQELARRRR
jgi:phosphoribosyl-AMP cyclohydrolase / phosphoribosyl-ATP pyrophosphohydrolase